MVNREEAEKLLLEYGRCWEDQDPDGIVKIFTESATYKDPDEPLIEGREAIRQYWIRKVVEEESDIKFGPLSFWIDGETIIAEWEAEFTLAASKTKPIRRKHMTEVAIITTENARFSSLREYYTAETIPLPTK